MRIDRSCVESLPEAEEGLDESAREEADIPLPLGLGDGIDEVSDAMKGLPLLPLFPDEEDIDGA